MQTKWAFCSHSNQKGWNQKEKPLSIKIFDCWVMGFVLKTNCKKKPFIVFHFWEFQKQQQEDIAVSPQYWARAAASKVVEQQASPKISNFPFWFSQNQKTNSILRKGFEIENSVAVMSPLNGHNKGPYKRSFWIQHLWCKFPWEPGARKLRRNGGSEKINWHRIIYLILHLTIFSSWFQ